LVAVIYDTLLTPDSVEALHGAMRILHEFTLVTSGNEFVPEMHDANESNEQSGKRRVPRKTHFYTFAHESTVSDVLWTWW